MRNHIIVGAGTAGAIIASRLSEEANTDVLVLEAGPDYESEGVIPPDLLDFENIAGPLHDWGYAAIPIAGPVEEAGCITLCAGSIGSPAILMRSGIGPDMN